MNDSRLQLILTRLDELMLEDTGPFPTDDCRFVCEQVDCDLTSLVPDLDIHFSTIFGFCSAARRIERWDPSRLQSARERTLWSFFDQHPEYKRLQWFINETDTPSLHGSLARHESMRLLLRDLLDRVSVKRT